MQRGHDIGEEQVSPHAVDVLIPVRDRARIVAICLDSVRAQTLQPNAVIVVDDGSTDDTPTVLADYARRWPRLRVIRSGPRGAAHARNLGLAASRSPFVAFLDSDDVWLPEKLERQMALFTPDRPQLGFVHCACSRIDEAGRPLANAPVFVPSKRGDVFDDMINTFYNIAGSASAVVARRDLVMASGGFDETLLHAEDRDLWLKLARVSQLDYISDALVALRIHPGNRFNRAAATDPERVLFQRLKVWSKWLDQVKDADQVLETFRSEAFSASVKNAFSFDFGLYYRLKGSDLRLAKQLFPSLHAYVKYIVTESHRRRQPLHHWFNPQRAYELAKHALATRVILRSRPLVRLFQKFGKFRNIP